MAMTDIREVFPSGWSEVADRIREFREKLWGRIPSIPAMDISNLEVPEDILTPIREKNRRRVRDEIDYQEFSSAESPFSKHVFFDDQLLEVIESIQHKYQPHEYVRQLVVMIQKFLNESAALRTGTVQRRINRSNAEKCMSEIRDALSQTNDEDEKRTLELLLMDLTHGGEEPWLDFLEPGLRGFVDEVVAGQHE